MITFNSMLMAKTLIWGMTFIKIPIPTWPISSAARTGMQSLTPRMVQSINSLIKAAYRSSPRATAPKGTTRPEPARMRMRVWCPFATKNSRDISTLSRLEVAVTWMPDAGS